MAMQDMNDQVQARLAKLAKFKEMGIEAYPHKFNRTHDSKTLKENKEALMASGEEVAFAGRVVRFNRKGKMCFMHLKDRYGRLQVVCARDEVGEENYEVVKMTDLGDFIGVNGFMFETQTGEYSVHVKKVTMLSKAVRPLPVAKEKVDENGNKVVFNEFADVDTRYRQRYIDMALNDDVKDVFIKRFKILQAIREYLIEKGFIEVETPTLQPIYGGANARPFTTHHNACDMTLYLRVAPELYLKRCIVGGMEKVFEFSKNFRNEGMDRTHSPEFTGLEFYEAYADYNDMMVHFENICHLVDKGARSAGADSVHAHVGGNELTGSLVLFEKYDFRVLAAEFDGHPGFGVGGTHGEGVGHDFLHKEGMGGFGKGLAAASAEGDPEILVREQPVGFPQYLMDLFRLHGVVALVRIM